jgi:hypothetical protein
MVHFQTIIRCDAKIDGGARCTNSVTVDFSGLVRVIDHLRGEGWAVSRDRKRFYCPECAERYRNAYTQYSYRGTYVYRGTAEQLKIEE